MGIEDKKIPIIPGVNDVPSEDGVDANHPNASFFCKQYNDLIDIELPSIFDTNDSTVKYTLHSKYQRELFTTTSPIIFYIDVNSPTDGNGLNNSVYNNPNTLLDFLSTKKFLKSIKIICNSSVNFGDFIMRGISYTKEHRLIIESADEGNVITFKSIESMMPLHINCKFNLANSDTLVARYTSLYFDTSHLTESNKLNFFKCDITFTSPSLKLFRAKSLIFEECYININNFMLVCLADVVFKNCRVGMSNVNFTRDLYIADIIFNDNSRYYFDKSNIYMTDLIIDNDGGVENLFYFDNCSLHGININLVSEPTGSTFMSNMTVFYEKNTNNPTTFGDMLRTNGI